MLGQQVAEVAGFAGGQLRQDGRQLGLGIDRPALVGLAVEMDGQVGDHGDGRLEVHQLAFHHAGGAVGDAAGQGQVAVEPGRQQGATIDFHAQLPEALLVQLGIRLDPQAGAVGVGTDQAQAAFQHRALAQLDGDDGGVIAGDVVTPAAFDTPGLAFIEAHIAGSFQALGQAAGGVEGGGRGLEEIDQALVQLFAHCGTPDSSGREFIP
ncbi:hypothetical protein D3C84_410380 [compost metagenome]